MSRRLIDIEKDALVGKPSMASGFDPFSIGDISAKEIGTVDRSINRRLGLRLQSKTEAREEEDEHYKNKLRFRDHYCTAVKPLLRSAHCESRRHYIETGQLCAKQTLSLRAGLRCTMNSPIPRRPGVLSFFMVLGVTLLEGQ